MAFRNEESTHDLIDAKTGAVLVLGKTGAGKSTLVTYLTGHALVSEKGRKLKRGSKSKFRVEIGDDPLSVTKSPTRLTDDKLGTGMTYWDCPGFFDTQGGMIEILNALTLQKLTQNNIKILLVVCYADLENRFGIIAEILKRIVEIFPDRKRLESCINLVITQIDPTDIEDAPGLLYSKVNSAGYDLNQLFENGSLSLFQFLLDPENKRTSFFPKPTSTSGEIYKVFNESEIRGSIASTNFVSWAGITRLSIGAKGEFYIREFKDEYNKYVADIIENNNKYLINDVVLDSSDFVKKAQRLWDFHQTRQNLGQMTHNNFKSPIFTFFEPSVQKEIDDIFKIFHSLHFLNRDIHVDLMKVCHALSHFETPHCAQKLMDHMNTIVLQQFESNQILNDAFRILFEKDYLPQSQFPIGDSSNIAEKVQSFDDLQKAGESQEYKEFFKRLNAIFGMSNEMHILQNEIEGIEKLMNLSHDKGASTITLWKKKFCKRNLLELFATKAGVSLNDILRHQIKHQGNRRLQEKMNDDIDQVSLGIGYGEMRTLMQEFMDFGKDAATAQHQFLDQQLRKFYPFDREVRTIDQIGMLRGLCKDVKLDGRKLASTFDDVPLDLMHQKIEANNQIFELNKKLSQLEEAAAAEKKRLNKDLSKLNAKLSDLTQEAVSTQKRLTTEVETLINKLKNLEQTTAEEETRLKEKIQRIELEKNEIEKNARRIKEQQEAQIGTLETNLARVTQEAASTEKRLTTEVKTLTSKLTNLEKTTTEEKRRFEKEIKRIELEKNEIEVNAQRVKEKQEGQIETLETKLARLTKEAATTEERLTTEVNDLITQLNNLAFTTTDEKTRLEKEIKTLQLEKNEIEQNALHAKKQQEDQIETLKQKMKQSISSIAENADTEAVPTEIECPVFDTLSEEDFRGLLSREPSVPVACEVFSVADSADKNTNLQNRTQISKGFWETFTHSIREKYNTTEVEKKEKAYQYSLNIINDESLTQPMSDECETELTSAGDELLVGYSFYVIEEDSVFSKISRYNKKKTISKDNYFPQTSISIIKKIQKKINNEIRTTNSRKSTIKRTYDRRTKYINLCINNNINYQLKYCPDLNEDKFSVSSTLPKKIDKVTKHDYKFIRQDMVNNGDQFWNRKPNINKKMAIRAATRHRKILEMEEQKQEKKYSLRGIKTPYCIRPLIEDKITKHDYKFIHQDIVNNGDQFWNRKPKNGYRGGDREQKFPLTLTHYDAQGF